tara:strand:+ start:1699 stop:2184 length:486 start_codon:yes stop_codon:yes gene_type:complete
MNTHSITLESFIKANTPEGMEYDKENSTLDNIVYKSRVKSTRWEDLGRIEGYYSDTSSDVKGADTSALYEHNENVYATLPQCKAHLAQAKLSQIMKKVNGDWVADWSTCDDKYCIILTDMGYDVDTASWHPRFLSFKSKELAEQVLRENVDLLEQYKPLAG